MSQNTTRRDLLTRGLALSGAALVGTSLSKSAYAQMSSSAAPAAPASASGVPMSDLDILNFALLLEYFEADYYTRTLEAHQKRAYLTPRLAALVPSLKDHEVTHVQTLTQAITQGGGTPLPAPQFQFPQEAFISPTFWSSFASAMEETGVGAYLGQAGRLRSPALLQAAASIYGVEERHAAILRGAAGGDVSPRLVERPLTSGEVRGLIARYIVGGLPT